MTSFNVIRVLNGFLNKKAEIWLVHFHYITVHTLSATGNRSEQLITSNCLIPPIPLKRTKEVHRKCKTRKKTFFSELGEEISTWKKLVTNYLFVRLVEAERNFFNISILVSLFLITKPNISNCYWKQLGN